MANPRTRKCCIVPNCYNTTYNSPAKLFFVAPFNPKARSKWVQAMNRVEPISARSNIYCCEDHFDIENDMDNYVKHNLVGGRVKLKKGVLPHKFECQKSPRKRPPRPSVNNDQEIKFLEELLPENPVQSTSYMADELFIASCIKNNITEDPFDEKSDQNLVKCTNNKAVQVALKFDVADKTTMTEAKYFRKPRKKRTRRR